MEKKIYLKNSYKTNNLCKDNLNIKEQEFNNKIDERYILLHSFISKHKYSNDFPFFNKVQQLLYAYFPTWSLDECKVAINYIEKIIKDNKLWQYFFLNKKYKFIDLFFNELKD